MQPIFPDLAQSKKKNDLDYFKGLNQPEKKNWATEIFPKSFSQVGLTIGGLLNRNSFDFGFIIH